MIFLSVFCRFISQLFCSCSTDVVATVTNMARCALMVVQTCRDVRSDRSNPAGLDVAFHFWTLSQVWDRILKQEMLSIRKERYPPVGTVSNSLGWYASAWDDIHQDGMVSTRMGWYLSARDGIHQDRPQPKGGRAGKLVGSGLTLWTHTGTGFCQ